MTTSGISRATAKYTEWALELESIMGSDEFCELQAVGGACDGKCRAHLEDARREELFVLLADLWELLEPAEQAHILTATAYTVEAHWWAWTPEQERALMGEAAAQ